MKETFCGRSFFFLSNFKARAPPPEFALESGTFFIGIYTFFEKNSGNLVTRELFLHALKEIYLESKRSHSLIEAEFSN